MKNLSIFCICMIALVAFAVWGPDAQAYQFYSDATNDQGQCAQCHTGYRDNGNYFSNAEGVSWGTSLHNAHLNNTDVDSSCDNCHGGAGTAGRTVNLSSSANAKDGVNAISCSGCHGRLEDTGLGAGLRQHHTNAGAPADADGLTCVDCHTDGTPASEDTMPPWYAATTNDIVDLSMAPCNPNGEENLAGLAIGLDNDGNLLYDGDDLDCVGNQAPTADPNGPYSGTVGEPVNFDGTGSNDSDGTIVSWDWDFGDGNIGTGEMPSHTYAAAGVYDVSLTVTDDGGATDTATTSADIQDPGNLPPVADANGPYSGEPGVAVAFDGSGSSDPDGTIVSWDWDFGDGNIGTGEMPSHTYAAAGVYDVSLTVTDDGGATDTATTTATIQEEILADVWLDQMRAPKKKRLTEKKQTVTLEVIAKGDGDAEQMATVCISADTSQGGVMVNFTGTGPNPNCDTQLVVPGNGRTTFTVPAKIQCQALDGGSYPVNWTATISAPENSDTSNDTMMRTTDVVCAQ